MASLLLSCCSTALDIWSGASRSLGLFQLRRTDWPRASLEEGRQPAQASGGILHDSMLAEVNDVEAGRIQVVRAVEPEALAGRYVVGIRP